MKRIQKPLIFCLLTVMICSLIAPTASAAPENSARAAVLYQPDTGIFLYEKNGNARMKMASTTKIMTALVAIENAPLDRVLTVPPEAAGTEGSSLYLSAGDKGTLESFLYALLLASANDAAATIAINLAGSIEAFADMMNERAASLGLKDTHFENPHGLDDAEHYTSAHDLALIAAEAMKKPTFSSIVSQKRKTIKLNDGETIRSFENHNRLLSLFPGAVGVKTGFTKASGRCLVSAAVRDGVSLIAVTLDCPDDWNTHKKMLENGFTAFAYTKLASARTVAFTLPVIGGKTSSVLISNPSDVYAVLPENAAVETRFDTVRMPSAPIKKGTPLGKVSFLLDGKVIAESPLIAENAVENITPRKRFFHLF